LGQSGDVIEELSKSCSKYDMNMGLYLSPWDRNSSHYGHDVEYNQYYMGQLAELLGNPKYGNKGRWVEVWMDGAKGTGEKAQKYDFLEWFDLIEKHQPGSVIFSSYGSSIRWIGNENGFAGDPCWSRLNSTLERWNYDHHKGSADYVNRGDPFGDIWSVGECDVSIVTGGHWYWKQGYTPRTMEALTDIYFKSVGRGEPLLLNVPASTVGELPANFVSRLAEFSETINKTFKYDFTLQNGVKATASSVRGGSDEFCPANALTSDTNTYWTMEDSELTGWLEIDLGKDQTFDIIAISEHLPLGQRVIHFSCEVHTKDGWTVYEKSNTIGAKRLLRGHPVVADRVRLNFTDSYAVPCIEKVGIFRGYGAFALSGGLEGERKGLRLSRTGFYVAVSVVCGVCVALFMVFVVRRMKGGVVHDTKGLWTLASDISEEKLIG
jgi:alpha-L-fucosidase